MWQGNYPPQLEKGFRMIFRNFASTLLLLSLVTYSESARADEIYGETGEGKQVFAYGSTCENLGQLSRVELVGVTHQTYSDQFAIFCKPDSVYRCEDYDSTLVGLGRLEDNGRGSCRYLPKEGQ